MSRAASPLWFLPFTGKKRVHVVVGEAQHAACGIRLGAGTLGPDLRSVCDLAKVCAGCLARYEMAPLEIRPAEKPR